MIYIDRNQDFNDTVRIFIPSGKSTIKSENVDTTIARNVKQAGSTCSTRVEQPASQTKDDTNPVSARKGRYS